MIYDFRIMPHHLKKFEKNDSKDLVDCILKNKESNAIIIQSNCFTDFSTETTLNFLDLLKKHSPKIHAIRVMRSFIPDLSDIDNKIRYDRENFNKVGEKLAEFDTLKELWLEFDTPLCLKELILPLLNKSLVTLSIGSVVLNDTKESKTLLKTISGSKILKSLSVDPAALRLNRGEILTLLSELESLSDLTFLDNIGQPYADKGLTASTKCPKLKELNLFSGNKLDPDSIERLKELLNNELSQLNVLRIGNLSSDGERSTIMITSEHIKEIKKTLIKPNSKAILFRSGLEIQGPEGETCDVRINKCDELSYKEKLNNLINEWYDIENPDGDIEPSNIPSLKSMALKVIVNNLNDNTSLDEMISKIPVGLRAPFIIKQNKIDVFEAFQKGKYQLNNLQIKPK